VALAFVLVVAALYVLGIRAVHRTGERWPWWPTFAFFVFGLGGFSFIEFGFLGTWSVDLRWAFSTRIALLLFAVPGLLTLGQPVTLARRALASSGRLDAVLRSWPIRLLGNPIFAPLFALAAFMLFVTPIVGFLRLDPVSEGLITIIVPIVGFLMVLRLAGASEEGNQQGWFVAIEFMFAFIELLMDAIPGILLRLNGAILDRAPALVGTFPDWFPHALRDQQLSGDLLWFIAEVSDVPILAIFIIRWMRSDKKEASSLDDLSDAEMDALTQAHLRGNS
jgi:putative membrane protein